MAFLAGSPCAGHGLKISVAFGSPPVSGSIVIWLLRSIIHFPSLKKRYACIMKVKIIITVVTVSCIWFTSCKW